jgi:hypothetical protein
MNPQDDPEARIRQLEQPLADYGAVELGATPNSGGSNSALPPPLPPPVSPPPGQPYTSPYDAPPMFGPPYPQQVRSSGNGAPIALIFGLIAVAVVVVFGAVAAVMWNMTTSDRISTPRVTQTPGTGGTGSVGRSPTGAPTGLPGIPDAPTMTTAPPGGQLSVAGVHENKTVACNDSIVSVSGVNNTVTIKGHCQSVTVSGVENQVTVDSADTIGASGFDNVVKYLSGSPKIDATGSNVIERG